MPGVYGKKKKKGKGKYIAFIVGVTCVTAFASAYMPHKGESVEFRVVSSTADFSDWEINGQVTGGSILHPSIKIAGLLEMSQESSNMKGLVEYSINQYIKLGLTGGVSNEGKGVGDFLVTGDIPYMGFDILPFVKVSHSAVAEAGLVIYFSVNKVVFNAGVSYQPELGELQKQKFSLMVGTGI